ncbi:hypothetical protein [Sphingomonas sp. KR3-1]|uniref:hypothetical protein n=1 Tax=Sphingomonas sp. KR3-1 TaxID=3156611 RepID=UPI0032B504BC
MTYPDFEPSVTHSGLICVSIFARQSALTSPSHAAELGAGKMGDFMLRMIRVSLAALLATLFIQPAYAQDQCKDILESGVFNSVDTSSRSEYQEIIISRFLSSTYEGSKRSGSGIGVKSLGELVMGSGYTENEYNQKKAMLRQSYARTLTRTEEWSLATRTADKDIVAAWQGCMGGKSGLFARFETQPGDGQNVTLVLTVNGAMGLNQVELSADTTIPATAQILSQSQYAKCLSKGAVITATAPCRVALQLPAATPLKLIVSTPQGDAEAYIGKRLRWNFEKKPFRVTREQTLKPNSTSWESGVVTLADADVAAGFTLTPGSIQIIGPDQYYGSGDGRCDHFTQTPGATEIGYRYRIYSTDNASTSCRLTIIATMEKGAFVVDE